MTVTLLFASVLCACSSESDIRSYLGDDGSLAKALVGEDEIISIRVHGSDKHDSEDVIFSSVYVEVEPNRTVYSRRRQAVLNEDKRIEVLTETMDQRLLKENEFLKLRDRLAIYRPLELASHDNVLTPTGCEIVVGGYSRVIVTFEDHDGLSGSFILPPFCDLPGSSLIAEDLRSILESLPPLDGVEGHLLSSE